MKTRLSAVYSKLKSAKVTELSMVNDIDNFFNDAPNLGDAEIEIENNIDSGERLLAAAEVVKSLIREYNENTSGEFWQPEGFFMSEMNEAKTLRDSLLSNLVDLGIDEDSVPNYKNLVSYIENVKNIIKFNASQNNQYKEIYDSIDNLSNLID
tara:strand:+ start:932 stop:1390 length:459 start_codon:yes stop_codon:yes gene_type:complete